MGDVRLPEAMADVRALLAAGINVVGSAPGVLQYPWQVIPDKYIERVEDAAREGNSSVFITGVDPGFATDLLPFALAGTCQSIQQIRTMEIADYATYDGATVMFDVMGFGNPIGDFPMLFQPGVLSIAWGTAIRQLAAGLGVEVDEIRDSVEQEPAPEDLDVAVGHIAKGTVAALRFQIEGMVNGRARHRRRARHPAARRPAPGLGAARPGRRLVPGRDHRRAVVLHGHRPRPAATAAHNYAAILAAAGRIVNAIPDVVAAAPGIRTTLDMPLVTGKGVVPALSRRSARAADVGPLQLARAVPSVRRLDRRRGRPAPPSTGCRGPRLRSPGSTVAVRHAPRSATRRP